MRIVLKVCIRLFCLTQFVFGGRVVGPQGKVSGGAEAEDGTVPYAALLKNKFEAKFCGGAIIAPQWILTAAHCLEYGFKRIAVGSMDPTKPGALYFVDKKIPHDLYVQSRFVYDIGLIKLIKPITFNDRVHAIPMARYNELKEGELLTIAGWGAEENGTTIVPQFLRTAEVKYIKSEKCHKFYAQHNLISEGLICTDTAKGAGTCLGDSGGAVTNENKLLVGIINGGEPCATGTPDFHASVPFHYDWIMKQLNGELGGQNAEKKF